MTSEVHTCTPEDSLDDPRAGDDRAALPARPRRRRRQARARSSASVTSSRTASTTSRPSATSCAPTSSPDRPDRCEPPPGSAGPRRGPRVAAAESGVQPPSNRHTVVGMTADALADGPEPERGPSSRASTRASARTASCSGSVRAGWAWCTSRSTGTVARWRSRCCASTSPTTPTPAPGCAARSTPWAGSAAPGSRPIIDADVDGVHPYIVTRYVPGPVARRPRGRARPAAAGRAAPGRVAASPRRSTSSTRPASCTATSSPRNVLLVDGDPVLIDFGIAHVADDIRLTMHRPRHGHARATSPPRWSAARTSRPPPTGGAGPRPRPSPRAACRPSAPGAMSAVLARVAAGDPDLVAVDPRIEPLLYAALSPDPAERPHHDEVVAALERYAHGCAGHRGDPGAPGAPRDPAARRPADRRPPEPPGCRSRAGVPSPVARSRVRSGPCRAARRRRTPVRAGSGRSSRDRRRPPARTPVRRHRRSPASCRAPVPRSCRPARHDGPAGGPPGWEQARPVTGCRRPPSRSAWLRASRARSAPAATGSAGARVGVGLGRRPPRARPLGRPPDRTARRGRERSSRSWPCSRPSRRGRRSSPSSRSSAWITLARTADRSVTSLVMRRHERGARGSDVAVAVASSPWHLVLGAVGRRS